MKLKALFIAAVMTLSVFVSSCGYTREVREFSEVVTTATQEQLAISSGLIDWLLEILDNAKEQGMTHLQMENPKYDPADINSETGLPVEEEFLLVPIQEIIDGIEAVQKKNEIAAEALSTLNESVKANRGLEPLFQQAKEILKDEEVMALIKAYMLKMMEKKDKIVE